MTHAELHTAFGTWLAAVSGLDAGSIWRAGAGGPRTEPYAVFELLTESTESIARTCDDDGVVSLVEHKVGTMQVDIYGAGAHDLASIVRTAWWKQASDDAQADGFRVRDVGEATNRQALAATQFREAVVFEVNITWSDEATDADAGAIATAHGTQTLGDIVVEYDIDFT